MPTDPLGRAGWGQSNSGNDPLFLGPAARVREDRFLALANQPTLNASGTIYTMPRNVLPDRNWDAFFGALREQADKVNYSGFGFAHQRPTEGPNAGATQDWGADPMAGAEIGEDGRYTGRVRNSLGNFVDQGPFSRPSWAGQEATASDPFGALRRSLTRR